MVCFFLVVTECGTISILEFVIRLPVAGLNWTAFHFETLRQDNLHLNTTDSENTPVIQKEQLESITIVCALFPCMGNLTFVQIYHFSDLQYKMDFSLYDQMHEFHVFTSYSMYSMRWGIGA